MASPDHHKRRWTENSPGLSIPSRPPLKKRFTSNVNIATSSSASPTASSSSTTVSPSSSVPPSVVPISSSITASSVPTASDLIPSPAVTETVTIGDTDTTADTTTTTTATTTTTTTATAVETVEVSDIAKPVLENIDEIPVKSLSKNAWLRRLQEAKTEHSNLETRKTTLETNYISLEAAKGLIRVQLNMIQQDLMLLAESHFVEGVQAQLDSLKESGKTEWEWLDNMQGLAMDLQKTILDQIKSWNENARQLEYQWQRESDISQKRSLLSDWLYHEMTNLRATHQHSQSHLQHMEEQLKLVAQQSNELTNETRTAMDELQRLNESLEECTTTLMQLEKRYDRSKSRAVASLAEGGLGELTIDDLDAPSTPTSYTSVTAASSSIATVVPTPSSSAAIKGYSETDVEPGSIADQTMKSQLSERQLIIDTRNKELSELKREKQSLMEQVDLLRLQIAHIPEERLMNTEYYKNLQTSYEYYRHRAHHLDQMRTTLDRTLDDLARTRKRWVDDLKLEKSAQSTTMETEMKRLENDLMRIRGQRDQFQSQYDEQVAKEAKLKEANELVIHSAAKEKEYIVSLESRLHDLKSDTTVAGPLAQDLAAFEELRKSLQKSRYSLERLQEMEQGWNPRESGQSVALMKERIANIRNQLKLWTTHAGSDSEDQDATQALMAELAQYSTESQKLSLMIDLFEKSETQLLDEIDRMASIYGRLEEQGTRKVFNDDYKQDHRLKLAAEKSKFAQTFPSLMAAKEKQLANVTALRITSDKQKDLISQLKDHEKSLELQLSGKENDTWRMIQSVEDDKSMVETLTQQLEESKNTLEGLDEHMVELQKVLKEKTRALEEEKHLQNRVEEDHEKMKRKWDMISHGDNPQEQQLAEECDELRSLLKCGTCRTRFRSHLLTRCMHTFCKKCIDARLETRQRRCPTCGESFGASDVRQFYL